MSPTRPTTTASVSLLRNCHRRAGEMVGLSHRSRSETSRTRSIRIVAPRRDRLVPSLNCSWTSVAGRARAASDTRTSQFARASIVSSTCESFVCIVCYERFARRLVRQPAQVSNTMVQATAAQNTNKANTARGSRNIYDSNFRVEGQSAVSFAQAGHCHQFALLWQADG
jgi:hypothetical protein